MRLLVIGSTAVLASLCTGAPTTKREFSPNNVYYPLQNGFPNPNEDQTAAIQKAAHGTLPNAPPPPALSADGVSNLKLIAFNELFEVAYFTELIHNITNRVSGYNLGNSHDYILDSLDVIAAQEELHLLNANGALKHFNQEQIQPCKYNFPVTDFQSAIALAGTFTDVVLGTLQDVNQIFAKSQDDGLVRAVSSVIGNEAEQEGFYRLLQKKRPSAQPFLTTATRDFAFTAIQSFVVPGSCPNIGAIPLKTFKPLVVETKTLLPRTQNLRFSFPKGEAGLYQVDNLKLVFLNGQNLPIVKNLDNISMQDEKVFFEANFPFDEFLMTGLTIAAVTQGGDTFENADKVAEATIFGPGLIELD